MNSNLYNVSNENLLLIEFLNNMYNDNLRQVSNFMNSINTLNESNSQIRSLLVQILSGQSRNSNNGNSRIGRNGRSFRTNNSVTNNSNNANNRFVWQSQLGITNNNNANSAFTQLYQGFFEPVEIYPTQMQIEAATRRVRYSDIISPKNRSCPIVMEDFNDNDMVTIIRHCGHIFNTDEINRWFTSNCRCPVCRYDIRNFNSTASSEYFNNGQSVSQSSSSSSSSEERINRQNTIMDNLSDNLIDAFINDYTAGTSENNSDASGNSIDDIYQNNSLIRILTRYRNLQSG